MLRVVPLFLGVSCLMCGSMDMWMKAKPMLRTALILGLVLLTLQSSVRRLDVDVGLEWSVSLQLALNRRDNVPLDPVLSEQLLHLWSRSPRRVVAADDALLLPDAVGQPRQACRSDIAMQVVLQKDLLRLKLLADENEQPLLWIEMGLVKACAPRCTMVHVDRLAQSLSFSWKRARPKG